MQKNNPTNFSAAELDHLLNRSFLELHLTKPKCEKITEVIAAQALGVAPPVAISTQESFIKKFIRKKILHILLLCFLAITGGVAGIVLMENQSEESTKLNIAPPALPRKTKEVTNSKITEKENKNHMKRSSAVSVSSVSSYENSSTENIISQEIVYPQAIYDSTTANFIIRQPKPIHSEDPEILLIKTKDSVSTSFIKKNSIETKKQKKRKAKILQKEYEVKRKKNKLPG